jgi:hypothetical protein
MKPSAWYECKCIFGEKVQSEGLTNRDEELCGRCVANSLRVAECGDAIFAMSFFEGNVVDYNEGGISVILSNCVWL